MELSDHTLLLAFPLSDHQPSTSALSPGLEAGFFLTKVDLVEGSGGGGGLKVGNWLGWGDGGLLGKGDMSTHALPHPITLFLKTKGACWFRYSDPFLDDLVAGRRVGRCNLLGTFFTALWLGLVERA